ncbi:MAG TPA: hypothetical protein VGC13_22475 [Longimicrobium sp.]|jgi:hypothetical protein|uniref:hypothetical protein n=1 Tax=Longimicrobium sp. TaxID=2029185 RepID=UPI002ED85B0E
MTTREAAQRAYWEGKLPPDLVRLKDVHRAINRGQPREQFSKKWLERQAAAGNMGAIGGPGTPLSTTTGSGDTSS